MRGLRACWQTGDTQTVCTSLGIAKALHAAMEQHADIINMSLGGRDDRLLALLLYQGQARGLAVVAADSCATLARHAGTSSPACASIGQTPD